MAARPIEWSALTWEATQAAAEVAEIERFELVLPLPQTRPGFGYFGRVLERCS